MGTIHRTRAAALALAVVMLGSFGAAAQAAPSSSGRSPEVVAVAFPDTGDVHYVGLAVVNRDATKAVTVIVKINGVVALPRTTIKPKRTLERYQQTAAATLAVPMPSTAVIVTYAYGFNGAVGSRWYPVTLH